MRIFNGFEEIKSAVGTEVGVSDWIEVTQDRIKPVRGRNLRRAMDPRRSGTRQKGIARRHYYRTRPAIAGADANVRSIGHGPEGPENT